MQTILASAELASFLTGQLCSPLSFCDLRQIGQLAMTSRMSVHLLPRTRLRFDELFEQRQVELQEMGISPLFFTAFWKSTAFEEYLWDFDGATSVIGGILVQSAGRERMREQLERVVQKISHM